MKPVQVLPILVGLSLCGASAALLYAWYKTKDNATDEVDAPAKSAFPSKTKAKNKKITKVECTISNSVVPIIIGRLGANVQAIEEKTQTKITFRQKDETNQICEISGVYENVMKAVDLVKEEASRSTNVTDEMIIPQSAYSKIIGRCGKILQDICRRSMAQVHIDAGVTGDKSTRRVLITGTRTHVNNAKRLIDELVRQDVEEREAENKREPRYSPRGPSASVSMEALYKDLAPYVSNTSSRERLNVPGASDAQLEVYVSAIASPARFWIQIVGPQTTKLDALVGEMTEYYSQLDNQAQHKIEDPYLGQIVTAMFKYDSKWYRAEIVGILPNEYDPRNVVLDLYFVDYGDSEFVQPHEVFEIRTDFLTLRFQAMECFLAHCQPTYPKDENQWNTDAVARFEDLTHVAKWKKLTAKIVTTKERYRGGDPTQREGSPIPGIELYDFVDGRDVSVAATLILEGFALPDNHSNDAPLPLSRYSSSDSVLRLDGGNSHTGSVAEKAMMFELTASLHNNSNSYKSSNGKISPAGQRSPSKYATKFEQNNVLIDNQKENNGNIENTTLTGTSSPKKPFANHLNSSGLIDTERQQAQNHANNNNKHFNSIDSIANRSWSDIMEAESNNYT